MESLETILARGRVIKRRLEHDHDQRMQSFVTDIPSLPNFVRNTLGSRIIHASFFEADEIGNQPLITHDIMITASATSARHWHFGYQRTLTQCPRGQIAPTFYRFYLVPAKNPAPVHNFNKFARRIAATQRRLEKNAAVPALERISFARLKPSPRGNDFGFCLDYIQICQDESSEIPMEFLRFVSSLT